MNVTFARGGGAKDPLAQSPYRTEAPFAYARCSRFRPPYFASCFSMIALSSVRPFEIGLPT